GHGAASARQAGKHEARGKQGGAEARRDRRWNGTRGNRALRSLDRVHVPIEVVVERDAAEVETGRGRETPEPGIARERARLMREEEPGRGVGDRGEGGRRPGEGEQARRERS